MLALFCRLDDMDVLETRCRPFHLHKIIQNLTQAQKEAVKEIGFGGLLHLQVQKNPTKMMPWLVERFDTSSRMFEINDRKAFLLTPLDVYDVFCIPMHGKKVDQCRMRTKEDKDPDFHFKRELRDLFDAGSEIHLKDVEEMIVKLVDGGELFKKLFVLHAMSSFLTPTRKRTVDMRLSKAVADVNQIKGYNWAEYVLDHFCDSQTLYINSGGSQWHCGCLMFLEIVYFHRLKFRGIPEPYELPLIQHWNDARIK